MATLDSLKKKIDWGKIAKKEGGQWLDGYLPINGNGIKGQYLGVEPWNDKWVVVDSSGVTVATGFDIGQYNLEEIRKFDLSEDLKVKILPYAAISTTSKLTSHLLIGKLAAEKLYSTRGLKISKEEAKAIDLAVPKYILQQLEENYEKERVLCGGKVAFASLPNEICTAIFSFAYQNGANWGPAKKGEKEFAQAYWTHITTQKWDDAVRVLRSYTKHADRRKAEAEWMTVGMKKISL
jgi:hypothetical protein